MSHINAQVVVIILESGDKVGSHHVCYSTYEMRLSKHYSVEIERLSGLWHSWTFLSFKGQYERMLSRQRVGLDGLAVSKWLYIQFTWFMPHPLHLHTVHQQLPLQYY